MLEELKRLLHEEIYPLFSDEELEKYLEELGENPKRSQLFYLANKLAILKAGMPEIKIGDITLKPPRQFFYALAVDYENRYVKLSEEEGEKGDFRIVKRYDQR